MGIAVECCFFFYHISQCILFGILTGILAVKAEKRNNLDTRMCFLSYKLLSSLLVNPFIYIFNIVVAYYGRCSMSFIFHNAVYDRMN